MLPRALSEAEQLKMILCQQLFAIFVLHQIFDCSQLIQYSVNIFQSHGSHSAALLGWQRHICVFHLARTSPAEIPCVEWNNYNNNDINSAAFYSSAILIKAQAGIIQ